MWLNAIEHFWADPLARVGSSLTLLVLVAYFLYWISHRLLLRAMRVVVLRTSWRWDDTMLDAGVFQRLAQMVPFLVIQGGIDLVPDVPARVDQIIRNVALSGAVLFGMLALSAALSALQVAYAETPHARTRSIKGYVQLGKIAVFVFGGVAIIATLVDRSPWLLLSGLGAMSAVLLLVFKDTLLSLVASVLLTSNDMLRVGDWIEMPQVGADGDVIDIALHTVKVQNWDKTITTIPTWRLISESFRNWRGMQLAGGRRIKRTLRIDTASVHFLDEAAVARLAALRLLTPYLEKKREELEAANRSLGDSAQFAANRRRLTNIGTFRAYMSAYLQAHPDVHQEMTCMVRSLEPDANGIPIEIYCFTRTIVWGDYERIQGDIFDHLLAILPEFGLRLYQNLGGADMRLTWMQGEANSSVSARAA